MRRIFSHTIQSPTSINKRLLSQLSIKQPQIDLRPTQPVKLLNHFTINNDYGLPDSPEHTYAGVIYPQDKKLNTSTIPYKAMPVVFFNDMSSEPTYNILSHYFRVDPQLLNDNFAPNIDYQITYDFINLLHFVTEMRFKLCMSNNKNVQCFLNQKIYNSTNWPYKTDENKYRFLILDGRESLREYDNETAYKYGENTEEYLANTNYEDLIGWFECELSVNKFGQKYCKENDFKYFLNENYRIISTFGLGGTFIDQHTINMMRMAINYGQKGFENKYIEKYNEVKMRQNAF